MKNWRDTLKADPITFTATASCEACVLIKLGCRDERMEDALAVLRDKWTSG